MRYRLFNLNRKFVTILFLIFPIVIIAQNSIENALEDTLTNFGNKYANIGKVKIRRIETDPKTKYLTVFTNERISYLPLRPNIVDSIYWITNDYLKYAYPNNGIEIISDGKEISDLIPAMYYPSQDSCYELFKVKRVENPLVKNVSNPNRITRGLENRHIALWQSHGRYYNQKLQRWIWQRPVFFQTVEDLYTQSYVLPFLTPMLENAGANVLLPRERDTQIHEVIIDAESSTGNSAFLVDNVKWQEGDSLGFSYMQSTYKEKENPFRTGYYYQTKTTNQISQQTTVKWIPDIPERGKYAVYVSYKTLINSSEDALYSVYHLGGKTDFKVNQNMGGGTWIYLGHFLFPKGKNDSIRIELSNLSTKEGKMVTADAIKIGGGMGNIARKPADKIIEKKIRIKRRGRRRGRKRRRGRRRMYKTVKKVIKYDNYTTSKMPRFTEGARYWLQWAGVSDTVYSRTGGESDYSDDFQSRGFWVNYLAGGSSVLPERNGLHIPIDIALAFHSDAGLNKQDSVIGTLGIYTVKNTNKEVWYSNGISRWNAREYTDIIQTQIVNDVRKLYNPNWIRRGLWNRDYSESRVPELPTMLLEILSHQNFADMKLGLDPRFRFSASRAIYKGMLKYLAFVNDFEYTVQPLPVNSFSAFLNKEQGEVELEWQPTVDKLEPTAQPISYIVYTRIENGDFDNGVLVQGNCYNTHIKPNTIYSFKIVAVNEGGRSFPSEILSVCSVPNDKPTVLIVNGFTKVSAPKSFGTAGSNVAGFNEQYDAGVPYISDISHIGQQIEFQRNTPYKGYQDVGFGASEDIYSNLVIAGNTFDYPFIHGQSIKKANYSFVSTSKKAILNGYVDMCDYPIVDLILGKESERTHLLDSTKMEFQTFEPELQNIITEYSQTGGNMIISGSNVISDLIYSKNNSLYNRNFVEDILKVQYFSDKINNISEVELDLSDEEYSHFSFYSYPNKYCYFVEAPDIVEPVDKKVQRIATYPENGLSAGIAYKNEYGMIVFGFPIEAITNETARTELFEYVLSILGR